MINTEQNRRLAQNNNYSNSLNSLSALPTSPSTAKSVVTHPTPAQLKNLNSIMNSKKKPKNIATKPKQRTKNAGNSSAPMSDNRPAFDLSLSTSPFSKISIDHIFSKKEQPVKASKPNSSLNSVKSTTQTINQKIQPTFNNEFQLSTKPIKSSQTLAISTSVTPSHLSKTKTTKSHSADPLIKSILKVAVPLISKKENSTPGLKSVTPCDVVTNASTATEKIKLTNTVKTRSSYLIPTLSSSAKLSSRKQAEHIDGVIKLLTHAEASIKSDIRNLAKSVKRVAELGIITSVIANDKPRVSISNLCGNSKIKSAPIIKPTQLVSSKKSVSAKSCLAPRVSRTEKDVITNPTNATLNGRSKSTLGSTSRPSKVSVSSNSRHDRKTRETKSGNVKIQDPKHFLPKLKSSSLNNLKSAKEKTRNSVLSAIQLSVLTPTIPLIVGLNTSRPSSKTPPISPSRIPVSVMINKKVTRVNSSKERPESDDMIVTKRGGKGKVMIQDSAIDIIRDKGICIVKDVLIAPFVSEVEDIVTNSLVDSMSCLEVLIKDDDKVLVNEMLVIPDTTKEIQTIIGEVIIEKTAPRVLDIFAAEVKEPGEIPEIILNLISDVSISSDSTLADNINALNIIVDTKRTELSSNTMLYDIKEPGEVIQLPQFESLPSPIQTSRTTRSVTKRFGKTSWPQYVLGELPETHKCHKGTVDYRVFYTEKCYKPIIANSPIPDYALIKEQEGRFSDMDEMCAKRWMLRPGQKLEYTYEDYENGNEYGMGFDMEEESKRRKSDVLKVLTGDFAFKYERLRTCYGMTVSLPLGDDLISEGVYGDGSFGFVMSGVRFLDGSEVAIKFVRKSNLSLLDIYKHEHFGEIPKEVYMCMKLKHENIIQFVDYFNEDEYFVLVTERHGTFWTIDNPKLTNETHIGLRKEPRVNLPGDNASILTDLTPEEVVLFKKHPPCDMFECLDLHENMPKDIIKKIFKQVAEAIKEMHCQGICHRDIKDENILVDENYVAKIIDFGSCAEFSHDNESVRDYFIIFCGTFTYAAPEIIRGEIFRGPEQDVWALGILLYTMVYCRNPFVTEEEILERRMYFNEDEDEDLVDLIVRMLRSTPEKRLSASQILRHPWMRRETPRKGVEEHN